jgi:hypothetical protein
LEVLHLLKLLLVEVRGPCDLALGHWDATGEIRELIQLIKVLGSIKQDLLVVREVVIWIQILVTQDRDVLLQVTNLLIEIDEFLRLLLEQEWLVGNVEFHDGFLLLVDALEVHGLVLKSLYTIRPLLFELVSIVHENWRLLDTAGESYLLDAANIVLCKLLILFNHFFCGSLSAAFN